MVGVLLNKRVQKEALAVPSIFNLQITVQVSKQNNREMDTMSIPFISINTLFYDIANSLFWILSSQLFIALMSLSPPAGSTFGNSLITVEVSTFLPCSIASPKYSSI